MNKLNLGMVAAVGALVLANPAHAVDVTVGGSIADNTLLGAGGHASAFDLSAVLQPNSQINSASYSFTFTDNNDPWTMGAVVQSGVVTTPFVYLNSIHGGGWDVYDTYSRNQTTTYTQIDSRPGEGATVTLGSASVAAGSGATAMTTSTLTDGPFRGATTIVYTVSYGSIWINTGCSNPFVHGCGYSASAGSATYQNVAYEIDTTTLNDQTGSFTVSGSITDPALFAEMRANQALSFSLGVTGDLMLSNATLTLDLSNAVTAVPEPSTFALAGAGLAVMLTVGRRRRQQDAGRFA